MKFIPPKLKGLTLPENLYWITNDLKSKNICEEVLKLEINALKEELEKTQQKLLSLKRKKVVKKNNKHQIKSDTEKAKVKISDDSFRKKNCEFEEKEKRGEEKKEIEATEILVFEKKKKYQKSKRLCPCCKEIVIRHHCLHNYCDPVCPIKLKKNKNK